MNIGYLFKIFLSIPAFLCVLPAAGHASLHPVPAQAVAGYREDINQDGEADLEDVVHLLRLAAERSGDPRADFNCDGTYSITDALSLLLRIRSGQLTALGVPSLSPQEMEVYPTWNAVGVEVSYSGELAGGSEAFLLWRKSGQPRWRNGVEMTVDTARHMIRASIFPLEPDQEIDVQVMFHDPAATAIPPVETSTRTKKIVLEPAGGQAYYVSPEGADTNPGTAGLPFRTLAHAAGLAGAGDVVYALSGVYREGDLFRHVHGEEGRPVVFAAAEGHQPILDSSIEIDRDSTAWQIYSGQVYVTTLKPDITVAGGAGYGYVAQDGKRIFPYQSLADLTSDPLGVPRAWYLNTSTNKLYLRTGNNDSPGGYTYNVAQHPYAVWLTGSRHVVVRGFEIRFYGQAGVRISEGATGCVIYGNTIHNAPNGVYLKNEATGGNAVWHNLIYEPGLVEIPWNSIKAGDYPRQGVMSWIAGRGNSFNYNTLHGWFDGITVESVDMQDHLEVHRDCDVMFNKVYNIGDDAFEMDGGGVNMRLHGNSVRNALVAISLAPIQRGPVYVTRNDVTYWNLLFKLNVGVPTSYGWTYVYHNSGYGVNSGNGMGMIGLTGTASDGADTRNKVFKNNAMIGADRAVRAGYDGNWLDYNCYYHTPRLGVRKFEWNGITYFSLEEFRDSTGQEEHGLYADLQLMDTPHLGEYPWRGFWEDELGNYPPVESAEGGDLSPQPASPLIDRGLIIRGINEDYSGKGPDIGAFEYRP